MTNRQHMQCMPCMGWEYKSQRSIFVLLIFVSEHLPLL